MRELIQSMMRLDPNERVDILKVKEKSDEMVAFFKKVFKIDSNLQI